MRIMVLYFLLAALTACNKDESVKVGFIGGVSGRFADLGTAGRNGAILAVEWRNAAGGVKGSTAELIVRDDKQDNITALDALKALDTAGVAIIIGPMTSSVASAIIPAAEKAGIVLISGTATSAELSGKDDIFFRVVSSTHVYGRIMADYQHTHMKLRRTAVIADLANREYTLSWAAEYSKAFKESGGELLVSMEYDSRQQTDYGALAQALLSKKPDVVTLVCNTVDAGMFVQKLRQLDSNVQIAGSNWAGTERLIELGGQHAEGMIVEQYFDRHDRSTEYLKFRNAYRQRFGQEPGYASVASFDAANVALDALEETRERRRIKDVILKRREFSALQGRIVFDANGEAPRPQFMNRIHNAQFEPATQ